MVSPAHPTSPRILVVDDDQSSRLGLCALLRKEGHEVHSASDGCKALGCAEVWAPDAVLTDIRMPGLGGIELIVRDVDEEGRIVELGISFEPQSTPQVPVFLSFGEMVDRVSLILRWRKAEPARDSPEAPLHKAEQ